MNFTLFVLPCCPLFLFFSLIGYSGCDGITTIHPFIPMVGEVDGTNEQMPRTTWIIWLEALNGTDQPPERYQFLSFPTPNRRIQ